MKAYRSIIAVALPLLALQACASYDTSREVTAQMARTEAVIQQADRSGVAVNSLPELQAAKDKYAEAKLAVDKKSPDNDRKALQLAKQAEVDAQYASAKSQTTSHEAAARDAQSGVETLRNETERNAAQSATSTP